MVYRSPCTEVTEGRDHDPPRADQVGRSGIGVDGGEGGEVDEVVQQHWSHTRYVVIESRLHLVS